MDSLQQILRNLKDPDRTVRESATHHLWTQWYREAGEDAEKTLKRGMRAMDEERLEDAEEIFRDLIVQYPKFSEAHNKRATVLYLLDRYNDSIAECEATVELTPHHFGAWNGLGMCLQKIGQYDRAISCFQRALDIQPYADINQIFIERCRRFLN